MSKHNDDEPVMIDLDEYEDEEEYEDDYDDDEYEDEEDEDYDYEELASSEEPVFDYRKNSIDSDSEDKWGFQDEEEEEEEEYEHEIVDEDDDEYEEDYSDDYDYEEDDEDDEYEDVEHDRSPAEPLKEDLGVVAPISKSNPANRNTDSFDDEDSDEEEREKSGDGEPIFEKLISAFKDKNFSVNLDPYDNFMSTVLTKLSALPIVGKLFSLFTGNKNLARLSPLVILIFIYGVCFVFSMFTGVSKTTSVLLPDNGEIELTATGYDKDTNVVKLNAENVGGVIIPFEVEEMTLHTFAPGINPLSWAKYKEVGMCSLEENTVEDTAEITASCELNEGEKVSFSPRVFVDNDE